MIEWIGTLDDGQIWSMDGFYRLSFVLLLCVKCVYVSFHESP